MLLVRVAIVTPFAFQTYFSADGDGVQVPRTTVSVEPTRVVPLIAGRRALNVPAATVLVVELVTDLVVYPVREPVTVTVSRFPFADAGTTKLLDVWVEMVVPFAFHTYFTDDGDGDHVPRVTVSVLPTWAVPLIAGFGAAVNVVGATVAVGALVADPVL